MVVGAGVGAAAARATMEELWDVRLLCSSTEIPHWDIRYEELTPLKKDGQICWRLNRTAGSFEGA